MKITKHRSVRFVKRRTRSALDNFLGKSLMFVLDTMLWVSEGITQCLEPKAITTSEKHVQTSPISTEKSPEMAWVDKVKKYKHKWKIYIYERFKHNISFNLSFVIAKDMLLDGHLIKERQLYLPRIFSVQRFLEIISLVHYRLQRKTKVYWSYSEDFWCSRWHFS